LSYILFYEILLYSRLFNLNIINLLFFEKYSHIIYFFPFLKIKIGDWGLGIGDWGLGIGPNPQSPIPNPQSPI